MKPLPVSDEKPKRSSAVATEREYASPLTTSGKTELSSLPGFVLPPPVPAAAFLEEAAHLLSLVLAVRFASLRDALAGADPPLIPFDPIEPFPHVDPDDYQVRASVCSNHSSLVLAYYLTWLVCIPIPQFLRSRFISKPYCLCFAIHLLAHLSLLFVHAKTPQMRMSERSLSRLAIRGGSAPPATLWGSPVTRTMYNAV
jgi:hypothetical protein